jgi:hypothetical protein
LPEDLRLALARHKPTLLSLLRSALAILDDSRPTFVAMPKGVTPADLPADEYETWVERAAIREYDGGLDRALAEALALEDVRPQMSGQALGAKGKFGAGDDDLTTCG